MNKKIKKLILTIFFILSLLIVPARIKAATTFNLLPKCDVTIYQVQQAGPITDGICEKYKSAGGCVFPTDYTGHESTYGPILQVLSYRACGFDDFIQLFVNAFQLGLGVLGLVVFFFFIWGGFNMIIAGGRTEKIQEAKNILKGAFIGMIIVLTSWAFVNFYVFAIASNKDNPQGKLFYQENGGFFWFSKSCHETETYQTSCSNYQLKEGCGGEKNSLTDQNIRKLQQKLNDLGCDCGPVSGCFTPDTKICVTRFQIKNPFVGPTQNLAAPVQYGIVDAKTWEAIFSGSSNRCN